MSLKIVNSDSAPPAIGPYSQGIMPTTPGYPVYLSGSLGIDPVAKQLVEGGVREQAIQSLKNIEAMLAAEGLTLNDVMRMRVFMVDIDDYAVINEVYAEAFGEHAPAREAVAVKALPAGGLVEMTATAWRAA